MKEFKVLIFAIYHNLWERGLLQETFPRLLVAAVRVRLFDLFLAEAKGQNDQVK
jgi:hypothetical protein